MMLRCDGDPCGVGCGNKYDSMMWIVVMSVAL